MKKRKLKITKSKNKKSPILKNNNSVFTTKNVWPSERDFMTRPDRWKYVRKLLPDKGCVFCGAWTQGIGESSLVVHMSNHAMIILNKYPYNTAHTMVVPKRHINNLTDLTADESADIYKLLHRVVDAINKEYQPAGFNIGMNLGAVAGAGIPDHIHWHIVPRWFGDTNFFPIIGETKVIPEDTAATFSRLQGALK